MATVIAPFLNPFPRPGGLVREGLGRTAAALGAESKYGQAQSSLTGPQAVTLEEVPMTTGPPHPNCSGDLRPGCCVHPPPASWGMGRGPPPRPALVTLDTRYNRSRPACVGAAVVWAWGQRTEQSVHSGGRWPAELGDSALQIGWSHEPNRALSWVVISATAPAEAGLATVSLVGSAQMGSPGGQIDEIRVCVSWEPWEPHWKHNLGEWRRVGSW